MQGANGRTVQADDFSHGGLFWVGIGYLGGRFDGITGTLRERRGVERGGEVLLPRTFSSPAKASE